MPYTVKFDPTVNSQQASVIPNATLRNDGVMTEEQVAELRDALALEDAFIYVDATNGDDDNSGSEDAPVATLVKGLSLLPSAYKKACRLYLAPGTYDAPDASAVQLPRAQGPYATTFIILASGDLTQLAAGTETTGGSVRTLTDAAAPFGTTDSLAGYWVRITSGAQLGQRAQIKSNTSSVIQLMTDLPGAAALGVTFVVEKPAVIIDVDRWRPINTQFAFKDVTVSLPNSTANTFLNTMYMFMCGCEVILGGSNASFQMGFGAGSFQSAGFFATWELEGSSSPFPTTAENNAGVRVSGAGGNFTCRSGRITSGSVIFLAGAVNFINDAGGAVSNIGSSSIIVSSMSTGLITNRCSSFMSLAGLSSSNKARLDTAILNETGASLLATNAIMSSIGGGLSAIRCKRGSYARLTGVTGTGNALYGIEVDSNSSVEIDSNTTVTGTSGDMKVGGMAVRTYVDFRANAPLKNQFDVPGFTGATADTTTGARVWQP